MATKAAAKAERSVAGIGDAAVRAKTGHGWDEWLDVLDAAGGRSMTHREIVAVLSDRHGLPAWWRQMVAVGYEQERGLRQKYDRPNGYAVNVSRTLSAPLDVVYAHFATARGRKKWAADVSLEPGSSSAGKVCRFRQGSSAVEIRFAAKSEEKTSVAVEVSKLEREADVERMRAVWAALLDRAKTTV